MIRTRRKDDNLNEWPKKPTEWIEKRTLYISIPFTWNIPDVTARLQQRSMFWDRVVVGGPAVYLMPEFFDNMKHVEIGYNHSGVLQKVNPLATRTTVGCIRKCKFCGVKKFEPKFKELDDWPDLPIICDNNLLASSQYHFSRVVDRLKKHQGVDFNQGLDARLLTDYHAKRFAEVKGIVKRGLRLALDSRGHFSPWMAAYERLRTAGIAKRKISTYVLIAFNSDPSDAWARCELVEKQGVRALPMWFHPLDTLNKNTVTEAQKNLGWNDFERRKIMQWFYQHKKAVKIIKILKEPVF